VLAVLAIAAPARADDDGRGTWVGAEIAVLPNGTLTSKFLGVEIDSDTETAYGVGFFVENHLTDLVSIGISPRMLVNVVQTGTGHDSGQQLDLRARVAVGKEVVPKVRLYGTAMPGYSIGFPPSDTMITSHPSGFIFGIGGGAAVALGHRSVLSFELGYQWGFQSGSQHTAFGDIDYTYKDSYLSFTFGIAGTVK
jgi:hypothetical protein